MYSHKQLTFVILAIVITIRTKNASPLERSGRTAREVYPEIEPENEGNQAQVCVVGDVVYSPEEPVPAEQPCLKCKCRPPSVLCETLQCQKRPGCKAIHRPNNCCPDYQCECEVNGKFYANGEKLLAQPGGECRVCYCRGGEVQCAEVSCYIRKDCDGRRVAGQCCPKYDHCPPIDALLDRPVLTTEPSPATIINREIFDLLQNSSDSGRTSNEIQDDDSRVYNSTQDIELEQEPVKQLLPKITIQEIIPEKKEIPITSSPPKLDEPHGTLLIEEATDNTSNHLVTGDSEVDSSEVSEVFHHAPPVLRIGDKLLFLKKDKQIPENETSSPPSIITIIGAEGLQRGGFEESGEVLEVKVKPEPEYYLNKEKGSLFENSNDTNDLELKTSESTHILSLVRKKNNPTSTTTIISLSSETPTIVTEANELSLRNNTDSPELYHMTLASHVSGDNRIYKNITEADSEIATTTIKNEQIVFASTATPEPITTTKNAEQAIKSTEPTVVEQNPAYPPIPDIMSPYIEETQKIDAEENQEHSDNESAKNSSVNIKILADILQIRNNKTVPENTTNSEWLKSDSSESLVNFKGSLPADLLNQPAPSDFETTTQVSVSNTELPSKEETTILELVIKDVSTGSPTKGLIGEYTNQTTSTKNVVEETTRVPEVSTEISRSVESVEGIMDDSGESTSPKTSHASVTSNENASIEKEKELSEATDMVSLVNDNSAESGEVVTKSVLGDVDVIDNVSSKAENNTNTTDKDVEVINVDEINKSKMENPEKILYEMLPEPVAILESPAKVILKRENSKVDEADEVFKELESELNPQTTERHLMPEEEQREADQVFRELLEETSSPKQESSQPRSREAEALQRVSDALAKLTLRGKQPDSSVLGVLTNFFSSQYRSYD